MTSTLVTVLRVAGRAGVAVCLWGDPGTGKSALIQAAAADDVPCEIVIGSLREPSDFARLPVVSDEGCRSNRRPGPGGSRRRRPDTSFSMSCRPRRPPVQAAMLGVTLERRVGDLVLPRASRSSPRRIRRSELPTAGI
jgi:hypothetical protein